MSLLYIIYQAVQFFASIIGPGTIFLMITGALTLVGNLPIEHAFIINIVPIIAFIVVSFFTKSPVQVREEEQ